MSKEGVPITYNGLTMRVDGSPESIGRAEAILREEQGVRVTDFIDELPEQTLRQLSIRCQKIFRYAELGGQTYSPEVLQEAWETYSKVESKLKSFKK